MNAQTIAALINAARRANTSAGWRSVRPFLAMDAKAVVILDGDDDTEYMPVAETLEGLPDERRLIDG